MVRLDLNSRKGILLSTPRSNQPTIANPRADSSELGVAGAGFISQILSAIERHVLAAESHADLVEKLERIKGQIRSDSPADTLLQQETEISSVLEVFEYRLRESQQEAAGDFQKILSLVNESFSCIQAGDEKSDERLKYFEQSLSQATKMDSLISVRRHLSGMLEFVREEGKLDRIEKDTKRHTMSEQLRHVQAVSSRLRTALPGRVEALD